MASVVSATLFFALGGSCDDWDGLLYVLRVVMPTLRGVLGLLRSALFAIFSEFLSTLEGEEVSDVTCIRRGLF